MATLLSCKEASLLREQMAYTDDSKNAVQRIFLLQFDSKPADVDEIYTKLIAADSRGAIGASYKSGDARVCKKMQPASNGTVIDYIVTCDYEVPGPNQPAVNPTSKPDLVSGSFGVKQETYFKDCSSTPQYLINNAGEPFTQLPKRDVGIFKFVVTGNRSSVPAATWAGYLKPATAINDSSVTIRGITFTTGVLRLLGIDYDPETQGTFNFFKVKWTLACDPDGWDDAIENRGFNELADDDSLIPITLDDGHTRPAHPWPLNADGSATDNASDAPDVTTFKPYPAKSFSTFGWTP